MQTLTDKTMKIQLTHKESEDLFFNSLCNGLSQLGYSGLTLDYSGEDYKQAKINYLKGNSDTPSYEDVLMQVLKDGNSLALEDVVNDGEYSRWINIHDVHENVVLTPIDHLMDAINEEDDATTAFVIIQAVFYKGEIIFG